MSDIPLEGAKRDKLLQTWQLRFMRSSMYYSSKRASFVRFYKMYRLLKDAAWDPDEPNINVGYTFGLIEQINAKVTEPILRLRPPANPIAKRYSDISKAKNFKDIAAYFYGGPNFQSSYARSSKERVICGTRFEIDEWVNDSRPGKVWRPVPQKRIVPKVDASGRPIIKDGKPVMTEAIVVADAEVPVDRPVHYGFMTRYPSVFDCYPEPNKATIGTGQRTDCSWFCEDMGEISLLELAREKVYDPNTNTYVHKYDLDELLHDAGRKAQERYDRIRSGGDPADDAYGPLISPNKIWRPESDYGQEDKDTVYPTEGISARSAMEDQDKVWGLRGMMDNEIVTLVQGKYVIHRKRDPWHVPVMPVRANQLYPDPEFIFGFGVIEPIEDILNELNDIHNLSMSQFIRIVNRLVAFREDRIVTVGDFEAPAGGKIRIKGEGPISDAIAEIPQRSVSPEMLQLESNARGLIEFTSGNLDGAPGVRGTKMDHKTKGGLEIISSQLAGPMSSIHRQSLINEVLRMQSMERLFSQHAFDKVDYPIIKEDGSTAWAQFDKSDIFTDGRGFDYRLTVDMTFGDTNAQRELSLATLDRGIEYEKYRREANDPSLYKLDISDLFRDALKNLGRMDTHDIFKPATGDMSPESELQAIMQGGSPMCRGDLMHHAMIHLLQRESPMLQKAMQAGKADHESVRKLELLIKSCIQRLSAFVKDPQGETDAVKQRALMSPFQGGHNG